MRHEVMESTGLVKRKVFLLRKDKGINKGLGLRGEARCTTRLSALDLWVPAASDWLPGPWPLAAAPAGAQQSRTSSIGSRFRLIASVCWKHTGVTSCQAAVALATELSR
jgi:hypothetical protein